MFRYKRIAAIGNLPVAPANGSSVLWTVNVNTGAVSAVLTIYDGTSASGTVVAVIDAASKGSWTYGVLCDDGIFAVLSGGNADVTIGHT